MINSRGWVWVCILMRAMATSFWMEPQENEDALDEFAARINLLKDSLSKLLKPDVIMKTLQSMASNTILPALSKSEE